MTHDTQARAFGTYRLVALGIDERHREIEPIEQPGTEDPQDELVRDTKKGFGGAYDDDFDDDEDEPPEPT